MSGLALPPKPRAPRELIVKLAAEHWARQFQATPLPTRFELAVRGYRRDSMGQPGVNDVGMWDDAFFWVTPTGMIAENGNTDPSRYGWNANAGKPMAILQTGCWPFRRGPHKGRLPAFRQFTDEEADAAGGLPHDGRFAVTRIWKPGDKRNYQEAGYYAINQHFGGVNTTSSEGCLTVPHNARGRAYLQQKFDDSKNAKMKVVWTILVDGPII